MARAEADDFIHSMRFHVKADGPRQMLPRASGEAQAGFSQVSTPAGSVAVAEYREGHYIYTRKQPGIPAVEDISLSRGVTRRDTEFWDWLRVVIEGSGEYRAD